MHALEGVAHTVPTSHLSLGPLVSRAVSPCSWVGEWCVGAVQERVKLVSQHTAVLQQQLKAQAEELAAKLEHETSLRLGHACAWRRPCARDARLLPSSAATRAQRLRRACGLDSAARPQGLVGVRACVCCVCAAGPRRRPGRASGRPPSTCSCSSSATRCAPAPQRGCPTLHPTARLSPKSTAPCLFLHVERRVMSFTAQQAPSEEP